MSHFEGLEWRVSGVDGHHNFARALEAPPPEQAEWETNTLKVEFVSRINDTEIIQELADAFRTNQWLTSLMLVAHVADHLVPILSVLPQSAVLEYLQLRMSHCAPVANGIAGVLTAPLHENLRELHFSESNFIGSFDCAWTALSENGTLEKVGFWFSTFDALNTQSFKACMLKAKFVLVTEECQFVGETSEEMTIELLLKSSLKRMEFHVDSVDFVERLLSLPELKTTADIGNSLPELVLTTAVVEVAQVVVKCLPYLTNLRGLSLYLEILGEDTITKALAAEFWAALKRNGCLHVARFFVQHQDRRCCKAVKYANKCDSPMPTTSTSENVEQPSTMLFFMAFQSDIRGPKTAIAAMKECKNHGECPSDELLANRALVVASKAAEEAAAALSETATELDAATMEEEQAVVAYHAAVGKVRVAGAQASLDFKSTNIAVNEARRFKEGLSRQRVTAMGPAASALAASTNATDVAVAELGNAFLAVEAAQIKATQAKVKHEAAAAKSSAADKDFALALAAYEKTVNDEVSQEDVEEADFDSPTGPSNNGTATSPKKSSTADGSSGPSAPVVAYDSVAAANIAADILARFFFF